MRPRLWANDSAAKGYDRNLAVSDVAGLTEPTAALPAPRTVWVIVPSGAATTSVITAPVEVLSAGDLIIDGENSRFIEDFEHATPTVARGIEYVDVGVSGGVWGRDNGYGLMVGGDASVVRRSMPIFDALRPKGPRDDGFVHAGGVGAGHYAKMVHHGIEYAMMRAFAEVYELLAKRTNVIPSKSVWSSRNQGSRLVG